MVRRMGDINAMSPIPTFEMENIVLRVDHDQRTDTNSKLPRYVGKVNRI